MSADTVLRTDFDPTEVDSVTLAIVEALSIVAEDLAMLPPIGDVIDTDAVDSLFTETELGGSPEPDLRLTFPYERWLVTVRGSGEVVIQRRDSVPID